MFSADGQPGRKEKTVTLTAVIGGLGRVDFIFKVTYMSSPLSTYNFRTCHSHKDIIHLLWIQSSSIYYIYKYIFLCFFTINFGFLKNTCAKKLFQGSFLLDFAWSLPKPLRFQFSMEMSEFGLEISFIRGWHTNISSLET